MDPYKTPSEVPDRVFANTEDARPTGRKFSRRGGRIALVIHSFAVIGFSFLVYSGLSRSAEVAAAWNLWMLVDFPISIGAIPCEPVLKTLLIDAIGFDYFYGFAYGSYFLVMGGVQYYFLIGWLVGHVSNHRAR